MTTEAVRHLKPLWFGENVSLMGHLHLPRGKALDLAVVICATPFGYENIAGHRGLRILADDLAARGMASLRFDVPGTGDSDGSQTVDAWRRSIGDAAAAARAETGCSRVAVVAVGLGATLAVSSMDLGLDVDKIVLWEPPVAGREWLRKHRAYHRIAAMQLAAGQELPPAPQGLEELSGFPLTAELAQGLGELDLAKPNAGSWPESRARPQALLISRAAKDALTRLQEVFSSRRIDVLHEVWDGLDQMYVEPHLSIAPRELFARMAQWLAEGIASRESFALESSAGSSARTRISPSGEIEEIAHYSVGDEGLLFWIETRPVGREPKPLWPVLLTGRAVRHIGPNRIWVRFAREIAAKGYASIRTDGRSVGDSDGSGNGLMPNEEYYQEHIYDDIERVMDLAKQDGAERFLMTGICSGATASYQVAWRRSDVAAIVMLNALQLRHDPEDDERAKVQVARKVEFSKRRLIEPSFYWKILKGEYAVSKPLKIIWTRVADRLFHRRTIMLGEQSYVYTGFHTLAAKPVEIDVFISGEDPIAISFLERHFGVGFRGLPAERIRVHLCPGADHTIRPFHAQEMFFDVLRAAVSRSSTRSGS